MRATSAVRALIETEMAASRKAHPTYPADPLRRTALVCEEAGEAIQVALDLTRPSTKPGEVMVLRERLRAELVQTAVMAVRALMAMQEEDEYEHE